jgi:hypothetical protein
LAYRGDCRVKQPGKPYHTRQSLSLPTGAAHIYISKDQRKIRVRIKTTAFTFTVDNKAARRAKSPLGRKG